MARKPSKSQLSAELELKRLERLEEDMRKIDREMKEAKRQSVTQTVLEIRQYEETQS